MNSLIVPVLKAQMTTMYRKDDGSIGYRQGSEDDAKFQEMYYALLDAQGDEADEALAVLLWFYVGEHPHEELYCAIMSRGARMLKPMAEYAACRPEVKGVSVPAEMFFSSVDISSLEADIRAGEKCEEAE